MIYQHIRFIQFIRYGQPLYMEESPFMVYHKTNAFEKFYPALSLKSEFFSYSHLRHLDLVFSKRMVRPLLNTIRNKINIIYNEKKKGLFKNNNYTFVDVSLQMLSFLPLFCFRFLMSVLFTNALEAFSMSFFLYKQHPKNRTFIASKKFMCFFFQKHLISFFLHRLLYFILQLFTNVGVRPLLKLSCLFFSDIQIIFYQQFINFSKEMYSLFFKYLEYLLEGKSIHISQRFAYLRSIFKERLSPYIVEFKSYHHKLLRFYWSRVDSSSISKISPLSTMCVFIAKDKYKRKLLKIQKFCDYFFFLTSPFMNSIFDSLHEKSRHFLRLRRYYKKKYKVYSQLGVQPELNQSSELLLRRNFKNMLSHRVYRFPRQLQIVAMNNWYARNRFKSRFINLTMRDGKRSIAEKLLKQLLFTIRLRMRKAMGSRVLIGAIIKMMPNMRFGHSRIGGQTVENFVPMFHSFRIFEGMRALLFSIRRRKRRSLKGNLDWNFMLAGFYEIYYLLTGNKKESHGIKIINDYNQLLSSIRMITRKNQHKIFLDLNLGDFPELLARRKTRKLLIRARNFLNVRTRKTDLYNAKKKISR